MSALRKINTGFGGKCVSAENGTVAKRHANRGAKKQQRVESKVRIFELGSVESHVDRQH